MSAACGMPRSLIVIAIWLGGALLVGASVVPPPCRVEQRATRAGTWPRRLGIQHQHPWIMTLRGGELGTDQEKGKGTSFPGPGDDEENEASSPGDSNSYSSFFRGAEDVSLECDGEVEEGTSSDLIIEELHDNPRENKGKDKERHKEGCEGRLPKPGNGVGSAGQGQTMKGDEAMGHAGDTRQTRQTRQLEEDEEDEEEGWKDDSETTTSTDPNSGLEGGEYSMMDEEDLTPLLPPPGQPSRQMVSKPPHPAGIALGQIHLQVREVRESSGQGKILGDSFPIIAVSHGQPTSSVFGVWRRMHRHFGELMDQELVRKSTEIPDDVLWHMLGPLPIHNRSRMEALIDVQNLGSVMSIRTFEESAELDEQCRTAGRMETLDVWVMIATGVGSPGVRIEDCWELVEQIKVACPRLKFCGVSGVTGGVGGAGASRDGLDALFLARRVIAERLGMAPQEVAVSAGQTKDYKECVRRGVDGVRVGEAIFGKRECGFFDWALGENRAMLAGESEGGGRAAGVGGNRVISENVQLPPVDYDGYGGVQE